MIGRAGLLTSLVALGLGLPATAQENDADLIVLMGMLQTMTHKLQLSLDHENAELAAFYAHELEELVQEVEEVEEYDGFPIGQLTAGMLTPVVQEMNRLLEEEGDLAEADLHLEGLIGACNACHMVTEHAFLVIRRNDANPYMQSFDPPGR